MSIFKTMTTNKFANIPSKKMYYFLAAKVAQKEISHSDIANAFEVYQANASGYLYALKSGTMSVKLEHILKAQKVFGLNPCDLFPKMIKNYDHKEIYSFVEDGGGEDRTAMDVIRSQQEVIKSQQEVIKYLTIGENGAGKKVS